MKYLLFANTDWYLANFRLPLIEAIIKDGHQVVLVAPPGTYPDRLIESGAIMRTLKISRRGANPLFEFRTRLIPTPDPPDSNRTCPGTSVGIVEGVVKTNLNCESCESCAAAQKVQLT